MNEELRKERHAILAELGAHSGKTLACYHALGQRIAKIRANPAKYGGTAPVAGKKYEPIDRLAGTLGSSEQIVYKALQFYDVYPDQKDVERLSAIRIKERPLTWTALIPLLSITDAADRDKFEKRMVAEGLEDAESIRFELQRSRGKLRSGGRPMAVPAGARQGMRQATMQTDTLFKKCREVWFGDQFNLVERIRDEREELDEDDLLCSEELADKMLAFADFLRKSGTALKATVAQSAIKGAVRSVPQHVAR